MRRWLFNLAAAVSVVLWVVTVVAWVRAWSGTDLVEWRYDRWLADRSAAASRVALTSDQRLWLTVSSGRVGPYNGRLVYGYYMNADSSGGRPRVLFYRLAAKPTRGDFFTVNADDGTTGFRPLRWQSFSRRSAPDETPAERYRQLRIGVAHWVPAVGLLVPPALWLRRFRAARRAAGRGRCRACGYDLRATPARCPECGAVPNV